MVRRIPDPGVFLLLFVSSAVFLGLAAWGYGGWGPLVAHPARAGVCLVTVLITLAAAFSGGNLEGFRRSNSRGRWVLVPALLLTVGLTWLPAYADRHNIWTIDGDAVRYLGLALFTVGCVLRIAPMFTLGRRFSWPLAPQEEHRLVTSGLYRYIRHPSYLGALLAGVGWALVFRSGIGLILMLLMAPLFLLIVPAEEALMASEFGEEYEAYRQRTWRILPFVY